MLAFIFGSRSLDLGLAILVVLGIMKSLAFCGLLLSLFSEEPNAFLWVVLLQYPIRLTDGFGPRALPDRIDR